jgi:arsenate reductase (thioredoxin)
LGSNTVPINILVLCTGNSARSILSEALFNALSQGRVTAFSAGSHPTGAVNLFAIETLRAHGHSITGLRSKSWDEYGQADSPPMDVVITVCSNAAGEICPLWPGAPLKAHWGYEDPAHQGNNDDERRAAFEKVYHQIHARISRFLSQPIEQLSRTARQQLLDDIGDQAP